MASEHKPGLLLLIHPTTAGMIACKRGEGAIAQAAILDGYEPVGPRGKAAAKLIRERAATAKAEGSS